MFSKFTVFYVATVALGLIALGYFLSSCQTTGAEEMEHCDKTAKRYGLSLKDQGFMFVGGQDAILKEGVASLGQFLNPERKEAVTVVMVDTTELVQHLEKKKFKVDSECQRGGKIWQVLSLREKVQIETTKL